MLIATPEPSHFTIDLAARRVTARGAEIRLTPTEWRLLEILVRDPGRLVTQRFNLITEPGVGYRFQPDGPDLAGHRV